MSINTINDVEPTEGSSNSKPSVQEIMAKIRAKVEADVENVGHSKIEFQPAIASYQGKSVKAGELVYSDELRYLNLNYVIPKQADISWINSHRGGFLGKIIVKLKRKSLPFIWGLLQPHFQAQQEFQINLVKHLNHTAKYIDARDGENFWELIRKIDYDINKSLQHIERLADEQMASLRSTEKNFGKDLQFHIQNLQKEITVVRGLAEQNQENFKTVDSVCRGLEGLVANITSKPENSSFETNSKKNQTSELPDYSYLLLENRFRGSEEEITRRQQVYLPYFLNATQPIMEMGSGRGELLELFKANNIPSIGIDIDAAMVEHCVAKGFNVQLIDAVKFLSEQPDASLGGLIAVQVVEHLERTYLDQLINLAKIKLIPGAKIIFETINPQSLLALSSNYFRDPTHVWPMHPDTLRYQMELKGLQVDEIKYLSPVSGVLRSVPLDEQMPPRWQGTVETINANIQQLNNLLYGFMDYAIIGSVK